MGQCGTSSTEPLPSMGRPSGSNIRPSVASPTGAVRPWPVAVTSIPLPRPSLAESMMQRTVDSLTCCATSIVRSVPSAVTVSASCRAGSRPAVNCTSTTGPATRIIFPCIIDLPRLLDVSTSQSRIRSTAPLPRGASGEEMKLYGMPKPLLDRRGGSAQALTERLFL